MDIKGRSDQTNRSSDQLLIRPDFSPAQGMISFANCLQLAHCWSVPHEVTFAISENTPALAEKRIADAGFACLKLSGCQRFCDEVSKLQRVVGKSQPAAVIVDGKQFDETSLTALRMLTRHVLWLRDDEIALRCEFFIDRSVNAPPPKKIASVARRIAVIVDGHDEKSLACEILNSIDQIKPHSFSVDICVDPVNPQRELLLELASASHHSVRVHRDRSRIEALVPKLDLGIVNFGAGCLQLAGQGVPMIAIPSFNDPTALRESLQNAGAVRAVHTDCDATALCNAIRSLIRDRKQRQNLSDAAKQCVDGQGARRIVRMLSNSNTILRKAS